MPTIKQLIKQLQKDYEPNDVVAAIFWTTEDIRALPNGDNLSNAQIKKLLAQIEDDYDKDFPVSNDDVEEFIQEILDREVDEDEDDKYEGEDDY